MNKLQIGEIEIHWLRGGVTGFDGGAMFGVVPKALWQKKYPANEKNQVPNVTDPMYFYFQGKHYLIDGGIGRGRLTEKQRRNYGVSEESFVIEDLATLGVRPEDIDFILMTHLHFDHVVGLSTFDSRKNQLVSLFPHAQIIVEETEWEEMQHPNIRSQATYWPENFQAIAAQITPYKKHIEIAPGISLRHTGGHSAGHAVITIESNGERAIHMADIFPTHAHQNVLWVTAYDDYPMTSIFQKEHFFSQWMNAESWFLFYHDAYYRAIKYNKSGEMLACILREQ
ncbi:YtnP family quorum-quenching lactonase [Listeria costaricensis]|uniref:YtnP family quorum-quenching lactonase n=1 Tax=Listeria costaricensis TaxID=2026604 RepID=UPI000C0689B8|nr:MBL fold metallo-hydrolase [Listeria costaricensis]